MKIIKFEGATMREALSKVKAELGDHAVVVSTRQIRRGLLGTAYEIAAAIEEDDDAPAPALAPAGHGGATPAGLRPPPAPSPALTESDIDRVVAPIRSELRTLRALVRASGEQRPSELRGELRNELAGLRRALDELALRSGPGQEAAAPPLSELLRSGRLTAPSDNATLMLIGPTGVGKTTAIAKIAARAALVEARRVALVTLDSYRVGGIDQIRTFADLIGVPLTVVDEPRGLPSALDALTDFDLILIDTAGRSPRDHLAIGELERVVRPLHGLEVHLTIAAGTPATAIDELHKRYAGLKPRRLLWTKVDEVSAAPELIRAPHRLELPVTWVTTGQAVPEDIEEVSASRLLELAQHGLTPRPAPAPRPSSLRVAA